MLPQADVAYRVTLPNGTAFYAANVMVLDPTEATPSVEVPEGVYLYLMDTNTFLAGYSFVGTKPDASSTEERMKVRFYNVERKRYEAEPLLFHRAGRDQVEGDETSPVEFVEEELTDADIIQTALVAALARPDMEANMADKTRRGFVRVNT